MAEVYLGHLQGVAGFVRPVAIKRVREAYALDRAFVDAFTAEARLAVKLSHPNIVSVSDYQLDEQGSPFLVMEYVEGQDLAALVATGALPCSVAIFVVAEMLRGLAYAHQPPMSTGLRGVVHRDISPHNVLLSWYGDVKVSDFGIAKAVTSTKGAFSATVRGKPSYMSPEQIGSESLDGRSDLFAVGAVLWELLAGKRAFEGVTYYETLARVVYSPIPSLRDEVPNISADLEAVVMKLLARDRNERYLTAQEALADLLRCEGASKDGKGELIDLMQQRLRASTSHEHQGGPSVEPAAARADQWPGPMGVRTLTRIPTERRTKTLDVPAEPAPQLVTMLAAAGRITTGPNEVTIAAPFPSALPAASLPLAAAAVALVPSSGSGAPLAAVEAMPLRRAWRKRRWTVALGSAVLVCGLAASLTLLSKPEGSASGQVPSIAPAAAAAPPKAPEASERLDVVAPAKDQAPPDEGQASTAAASADHARAAASVADHARAAAPPVADHARASAVPQPMHGRAERGSRRPPGEDASSPHAHGSESERQPPARGSEPQPTARRRIVEIDLGANNAH